MIPLFKLEDLGCLCSCYVMTLLNSFFLLDMYQRYFSMQFFKFIRQHFFYRIENFEFCDIFTSFTQSFTKCYQVTKKLGKYLFTAAKTFLFKDIHFSLSQVFGLENGKKFYVVNSKE